MYMQKYNLYTLYLGCGSGVIIMSKLQCYLSWSYLSSDYNVPHRSVMASSIVHDDVSHQQSCAHRAVRLCHVKQSLHFVSAQGNFFGAKQTSYLDMMHLKTSGNGFIKIFPCILGSGQILRPKKLLYFLCTPSAPISGFLLCQNHHHDCLGNRMS